MFGMVKGNGTRSMFRGLDFGPNRDAGCVRRHAKPYVKRRSGWLMSDEEHECRRDAARRRDLRHLPS